MGNLRKPEEIIIEGVSLKELIESHKKWLSDGEIGEQLVLKNTDLSHANLIGVNLIGANLEGVDLIGADLENANLKNANLKGADLTYANLRCANLRYADLKNTDLRYVNLENANLENASLRYGNLKNANLKNTNLEGANLIYAILKGANLENANLKYVDLRGANLEGTNLKNAKFYLTKLYKVKRDDLFEVGHIGSRHDTTHYFVQDNRIICECFDDSLEEFTNKVKDTYDKDTREYMEYMIAIDTFKRYKEMYTKRNVIRS